MLTNMKHPTGDYHYTESGLDNVYLVNGFTYVDRPDGREVVIEDIDGLHRAIGEFLITNRKNLSGKEIRIPQAGDADVAGNVGTLTSGQRSRRNSVGEGGIWTRA